MKQVVKWAAEGAVKGISRVFCNVWHTSVAVGMVVPLSVREIAKQGGTADIYSSLTDMYSVGGFLIFGTASPEM